MTDSTKCPVCGRSDIPDYAKGEVRCPDCGSDLKVFRLLNEVESAGQSQGSIWKPLAIVALVAAAIFAILYFTKDSPASAAEAKERISMLEDSISSLNEKINHPVAAPAGQSSTAQTEAGNEARPTEASEASSDSKTDNAEDITAPADKVTVRDGKKYYVVKKGDSWWAISRKLYKGKIKDEEIARMNGKKPTEQLEIGQEIIVK